MCISCVTSVLFLFFSFWNNPKILLGCFEEEETGCFKEEETLSHNQINRVTKLRRLNISP